MRDLYEKPDPVADRSLTLTRTLLYLANNGWTKGECIDAMVFFTEKIGRDKWPAGQQYNKLMAVGKIQPSLGKYTLRIREEPAIVYEGDEPICPLKLK